MSAVRNLLSKAVVTAHALVPFIDTHARTRRRLANKYLRGSGIEIGALHNPLKVRADVKYVDRLSRADLRIHYPELAALSVVEPDIIDDGELLHQVAEGSQDFIIANHFIEHCEDPIRTLRTFASRVRSGGSIYLAVPDKRYTFDKDRPSTTFEHLEQDYLDGGAASRWDHYVEFAHFANFEGRGDAKAVNEKASQMLGARYSIHFHVWTAAEFAHFLEQVRAKYVPQLGLLQSVHNGNEAIFVLRRA